MYSMDDNTIHAEIFIIVLVALARMTTMKDTNNYRCILNAVIHYLFLCISANNFFYFIISSNCESQ